jgi:DNA adenine methylase
LLNDANPHLIAFYRWLQQGLTIDLPMENDEALFYRHRERFNRLLAAREADSCEASALFYYLNRTGFNGLCRFNRSGAFNVPFGRYARIGYTRDFGAYRDMFAEWTFTNADVEAFPLDRDDFVYADPPYDVEFTQYAKGGFSWEDQERRSSARRRSPTASGAS